MKTKTIIILLLSILLFGCNQFESNKSTVNLITFDKKYKKWTFL